VARANAGAEIHALRSCVGGVRLETVTAPAVSAADGAAAAGAVVGNWNSGRRPTPPALQVLRGNPGKRRLPATAAPGPAGEVAAPVTLSRAARAVWDRVAPVARAIGTLTAADVEPFKLLCELQASLDLAARAKDAAEFEGFPVGEDGEGGAAVHPALLLEVKLAPVIRAYYEKFGLEPVGRARVAAAPAAPVSKWAGLARG
jgi:P27 family predicted phage terminase small subunit